MRNFELMKAFVIGFIVFCFVFILGTMATMSYIITHFLAKVW